MARPTKCTVDYFPHDTDASERKTLAIIEKRHGLAGYAIWFKLLEQLGRAENHFLNLSDPFDLEFISGKIGIDPHELDVILESLSDLGAIDAELWKSKIVWSDNFIERLTIVYNRRKVTPPGRPLCKQKSVPGGINRTETPLPCDNSHNNPINVDNNPQSKVNKKKVYTPPVSPPPENDENHPQRNPDTGLPPYGTSQYTVLYSEAVKVLRHINSRFEKRYPEKYNTARYIMERLQEGATPEQCIAVADMKGKDRHFQNNPELMKPSVLYSRSKFWEYTGQLPAEREDDGYDVVDEPDGNGGFLRVRKYRNGSEMIETVNTHGIPCCMGREAYRRMIEEEVV